MIHVLPSTNAAEMHIRRINDYAAPKDKLYCIHNCCRLVNRALQEEPDEVTPLQFTMYPVTLSIDGHCCCCCVQGGGSAAGADEFLPMLIYALLRVSYVVDLVCPFLLRTSRLRVSLRRRGHCVYPVVQANPKHFVSNLAYISEFHSRSHMKGEMAYFLMR